jgi:putative endonuclease
VSVKSDPATWSDPRHRRGLAAEREAAEYLTACGWDVLAHRFRVGRWEVDLVAQKGRLVAFVEVKARRGRAFGAPEEAVTWSKRREIVRVANAWQDRFGRAGDEFRFDVVAVSLERRGVARVLHIEGAFWAGWR